MHKNNLLLKPQHLEKGDTVGLVSPSSTIKPFPNRTDRAVKELEKMGVKVQFGKNSLRSDGYNPGTPQQRAEDINNFFADKKIKAIMCTTGGYTSNSVLPYLDYKNIVENPKVFCGYSDITALLLAIYTKTGLITFHGPTLLSSFGDFGGICNFTRKWFIKAIFSNKPLGVLESSKQSSDENLWWDKDDNRAPKMQKATPVFAVNNGFAAGKLIGGNLDTISILGGTEYLPDFSDAILFLEDIGKSTSYIERQLNYLEQLGIFDKIKGIIYGKTPQFDNESSERNLKTILEEFGRKYNFPIVINVDCGHTRPMLTFPIGLKVVLDANSKKITLPEGATT
jgi:muramoyltetrapeptide carboxypeptidase